MTIIEHTSRIEEGDRGISNEKSKLEKALKINEQEKTRF